MCYSIYNSILFLNEMIIRYLFPIIRQIQVDRTNCHTESTSNNLKYNYV